MKLYQIYQHPNGNIEAVKQGWSWPGFCFTWIWALTKKMFTIGALIFCISFPFAITPVLYWAYFVGCAIWLGSAGNEMRRKVLVKKGYGKVTYVTSYSPEGAIDLFLKQEGQ